MYEQFLNVRNTEVSYTKLPLIITHTHRGHYFNLNEHDWVNRQGRFGQALRKGLAVPNPPKPYETDPKARDLPKSGRKQKASLVVVLDGHEANPVVEDGDDSPKSF